VASGTAVLRVHATSDFDGQVKSHHLDPVKVASIYETLSDGNALAPMMAGLILDREKRQKTECDRISKGSNGRIHFIDRPMLEDYFLHASAIATLIHERTDSVVTTEAVETSLEAAKQQPSLWLKPKAKNVGETCLQHPQPRLRRIDESRDGIQQNTGRTVLG